jgi:hypothetical protein
MFFQGRTSCLSKESVYVNWSVKPQSSVRKISGLMQKYEAGAQYILQNIPGFKEVSHQIKQL